MLTIDQVSLRLGEFSLKQISLTVEEGEYVVILGMSGVGKTVLLEVLAGIIECEQGSLTLDGTEITRQKIQKRPLGLVYQDQALFPHMSVRRNLGYGLRSHGCPSTEIKRRVEAISAQLGIEHLQHRSPSTLSGGEAQRVALGRVLVTEPRLLLLDEPLSALDPQSRREMQALLRRLHRQGQTILHVTHDYEEAVSLASRIILMEKGTIAQTGKPGDIFLQPRSPFVARFVGIRNFVDGHLQAAAEVNSETATFIKNGVAIAVMSSCESGPGYFMLRSEDIILSNHADETSALNRFRGTISDIIPSSSGIEVVVDIGFELVALITRKSMERLSFSVGKSVYISFKATAARFIPRDGGART